MAVMIGLSYEKLDELRYEIEQTHLGYLSAVDRKEVLRAKLESFMREYLCLARHDQKFTFPQTAQVLRRSAGNSEHFSGKRAALAWSALAEYADNLVQQPWRREFRQIKLYCGFYRHKIESSLVGAELMFEAMGYKHSGDCILTLPGPLDPDQLMSVSKDAILAQVECNIMQEIRDAMANQVKWSEILEYRENHIGTADNAVRNLRYRNNQRQYQENLSRRPRTCSYAGYFDNNAMQHASHASAVSRYAHIVSPQQIVPPPTMYQTTMPYMHLPVLKPHDLYPTNGYPMHYPGPHYMPQNGYAHPQYPPMYTHHQSVPTAQLIELEPSPGHVPHMPHATYPYHVPEPVRNAEFLSKKAKEDGAGSWEAWDYVYRSLESGKDNAERTPQAVHASGDEDVSDRLRNLTVASKPRTSVPPKKSDNRIRTEGDGEARNRQPRKSVGDVDEVLQKHRLSKSPNEDEVVVEKSKSPSKPLIEYDTTDSSVSRVKTSTPNDVTRSKKIDVNSDYDTKAATPNVEKPRRTPEPLQVATLDVAPTFLRETSPVVKLPPEEGKWQCVTCTYSNKSRLRACEMCGKSRDRGSEIKPQPCGGKECPQCTLVNKPGQNFCEACSCPLKNSPTYI